MPVVDIAAFEADMVKHYPLVPWREPLIFTLRGADGKAVSTLGCRICVAAHGMKGADAVSFPKTKEEFELHVSGVHPKPVSDA